MFNCCPIFNASRQQLKKKPHCSCLLLNRKSRYISHREWKYFSCLIYRRWEKGWNIFYDPLIFRILRNIWKYTYLKIICILQFFDYFILSIHQVEVLEVENLFSNKFQNFFFIFYFACKFYFENCCFHIVSGFPNFLLIIFNCGLDMSSWIWHGRIL